VPILAAADPVRAAPSHSRAECEHTIIELGNRIKAAPLMRRGGLLGAGNANPNMDTAIAIRTAVIRTASPARGRPVAVYVADRVPRGVGRNHQINVVRCARAVALARNQSVELRQKDMLLMIDKLR